MEDNRGGFWEAFSVGNLYTGPEVTRPYLVWVCVGYCGEKLMVDMVPRIYVLFAGGVYFIQYHNQIREFNSVAHN